MFGIAAGVNPIIVTMGVSGSGKTTLGRALATQLGWPYQDGDDFHTSANKKKMQAGIPLDDNDRAPWLAAIAKWMDLRIRSGEPSLIGCSALKHQYRDFLRAGRPQVWFLYLKVPRPELQRRVESRQHAYMPASLLDSQLDTLEEPTSDEPRCITLDAGGEPGTTVGEALRALHAAGAIGQMPLTSG